MKIIRWLLSHTVLILLIVAVIYGYMFWGNLAGEDTPAGKALAYLTNEYEEVAEFVAAVKAKQENLSQQELPGIESSAARQPSPENDVPAVAESVDTGTPIQLAETQVVETPVVEQDLKQVAEKNNFTAPVDENISENRNAYRSDYRNVEPPQVSSGYSHDQAPVKSKTAAIITAADEPVVDVVKTNLQSMSTVSKTQSDTVVVTKDSFVSAQIEKQLDNVARDGRSVDDSLKQDSRQDDNKQSGDKQDDDIRENWIAARKSFYQRKYDLSEQNYQKVIDSTEDNVDAYGELGNVYFNQGKNEQAASAYFEAAAILVRQGQVNRARSLLGLLRHLDKSKASELQELIDSLAS